MRFCVVLSSEKERAKISLDYRRRFISFLKIVLRAEYFKEKAPRPYTFAVYFGKNKPIKEGFINEVERITFRFSSGDPVVLMEFYNGILRLKKEKYLHEIGDRKFLIIGIKQEEEKEPKGYFKTLSPVVVDRLGYEKAENPKERYAVPWEEDFLPSLLSCVALRFKEIKGYEPKFKSVDFKPIQVKEQVIKHYGGYLRGFVGEFYLWFNDPEVMKFVYQYGLGVRTGQGFGYLQVVSEPVEKKSQKPIHQASKR
ncbi:MAG: CRISPR-associated endoribonuclease Cas6 [Acidobacteria bacterium]|jgi:CRISPR-associated endoribonuclease Cas6|nr:MAG: CRISPR-associated endoribonuclease Cas6 [Acidobacteriota bacterium]